MNDYKEGVSSGHSKTTTPMSSLFLRTCTRLRKSMPSMEMGGGHAIPAWERILLVFVRWWEKEISSWKANRRPHIYKYLDSTTLLDSVKENQINTQLSWWGRAWWMCEELWRLNMIETHCKKFSKPNNFHTHTHAYVCMYRHVSEPTLPSYPK